MPLGIQLALQGEVGVDSHKVQGFVQHHLVRSECFDAKEERGSFLGLEDASFFHNYVQNRVVAHRLVHEGNVNLSRQQLVDLAKPPLHEQFLRLGACVLHDVVAKVSECFEELRGREVGINEVCIFSAVESAPSCEFDLFIALGKKIPQQNIFRLDFEGLKVESREVFEFTS